MSWPKELTYNLRIKIIKTSNTISSSTIEITRKNYMYIIDRIQVRSMILICKITF